MALGKQMTQEKPVEKPLKSSDKAKDMAVKAVDKSKKSAKESKDEPDSWASLSGFKDQSSRRSIYKSDDAARNKEVPKYSIKQAIETEMSDATNLKTDASDVDSTNSLYQDYKAKKKYDFIMEPNVFFGGRDQATPVIPAPQPEKKQGSVEEQKSNEKQGSNEDNSYTNSFFKIVWSYLGYK